MKSLKILAVVIISAMTFHNVYASDTSRQPQLPETTPRLLYIQSIVHQIYVGNAPGAICLAEIYARLDGPMDEATTSYAGQQCDTYMVDTIFVYDDWTGAMAVFERRLYNAYTSKLTCLTKAFAGVTDFQNMRRHEAQNLGIRDCAT